MNFTRRIAAVTALTTGLFFIGQTFQESLLAQAPPRRAVPAPKPSPLPTVLFDPEPENPLSYLAMVRAEINQAQSNKTLTPEQQGILVEAVLKKYPRAASYFEAEARAEEALKTAAQTAAQAGARRISSGAVWDAHFPSTPITVALERANLVPAAALQGNQSVAKLPLDTGSKLTIEDKRLIAEKISEIQAFIAQGMKEDNERIAMVQAEEAKKSGGSKARAVVGTIFNRNQAQQKAPTLIVSATPDDGLRYIEPAVANDLLNRNKVYAAQGAAFEQLGTVSSLVARNLSQIRQALWTANGGKDQVPAPTTTTAANLIVGMAPKDVKLFDAATFDLLEVGAVTDQLSNRRFGQVEAREIYVGGFSGVINARATRSVAAAREVGLEVATVVQEAQTARQEQQRQQQQRQQQQQPQESITIRPNIPYNVRRRIPVQLPGTVQVPVPGTKRQFVR
jgi:hypothetical protein